MLLPLSAPSDLREQRKPLLRTAQQAEQTIAGGICDMTTLADADADEIRATLSALGLTVAKVPIAQLHPRQDGTSLVDCLLQDHAPLHRIRKLQAGLTLSAMW